MFAKGEATLNPFRRGEPEPLLRGEIDFIRYGQIPTSVPEGAGTFSVTWTPMPD